jgi:hypothetical protein
MGIFMMTFWLTTDPTPTPESYVQQLRHIVKVGGIEAAAIANDYPLAGEQSAVKAGNDNSKMIANYYQWCESVVIRCAGLRQVQRIGSGLRCNARCSAESCARGSFKLDPNPELRFMHRRAQSRLKAPTTAWPVGDSTAATNH